MFKKFRAFIRDRNTVITLHSGAEKQARMNGDEKPGAEHFLLAALELSDGTAKRAFESIGIDPGILRSAINKQVNDTLKKIGIDTSQFNLDNGNPDSVSKNRIFPNWANSSGHLLIKEINRIQEIDLNIPLIGAHVVAAIAKMKFGITIQTFRTLGINTTLLYSAAQTQLKNFT